MSALQTNINTLMSANSVDELKSRLVAILTTIAETPANSGITAVTSDDGSISIDNTDPIAPDLSVADFAIPLEGTQSGNIVTGQIEMNSGNITSIFKKQGDSKWQIYLPDEASIGFINESIEDTEGTSFIVGSSNITVGSSVSGFPGIRYSGSYEDNFQDSSLVNKGYVNSLLKNIADEIPDATDEASAISGLNSLLTALRAL